MILQQMYLVVSGSGELEQDAPCTMGNEGGSGGTLQAHAAAPVDIEAGVAVHRLTAAQANMAK